MIVPSISIAFSEFMIKIKCRPAPENFEAGRNNRFRIYRRLPANERLPPPPDGRGRSSRARASFTVSARPVQLPCRSARRWQHSASARVIHGDERKAARSAGHAIHHQRDFGDLAVLFEKILKIVFSGLKREITYVQFHCDFWSNTCELQSRSRESGFKSPMRNLT